MNNPWKEVALDDYEKHMALSNVYQLQTLDRIMGEQFDTYPISSVAVLGVAGGNGLGNLVGLTSVKDIYGVDINQGYLDASRDRYPELSGRYHTVLADINDSCDVLPHVDLVIANLFIEYVGCRNFAHAVEVMKPHYVSCVIQVDPAESFVSDSPYTSKLEVLDCVHNSVDAEELKSTMLKKGYVLIKELQSPLPNGKIFTRLDFCLISPVIGS